MNLLVQYTCDHIKPAYARAAFGYIKHMPSVLKHVTSNKTMAFHTAAHVVRCPLQTSDPSTNLRRMQSKAIECILCTSSVSFLRSNSLIPYSALRAHGNALLMSVPNMVLHDVRLMSDASNGRR